MPSGWHAPGFHIQTNQDHRQCSRHGSLAYETLALPANNQPSSTSNFRLQPLPFTASKNSSPFGKFIIRCSKRRIAASLQTAIALASKSGTTHGEGGRSVLVSILRLSSYEDRSSYEDMFTEGRLRSKHSLNLALNTIELCFIYYYSFGQKVGFQYWV